MTAVSPSDSLPLAAPGARRRAVAAARAHSRLVRVLRLTMPALAVLVVGGFFGIIVTDPRNALSSHEAAGALGVQSGTITMEAPHLTGFNANGQTYEVVADRAEQSVTDPSKVKLNQLTAKVEMRSEGWSHFTAGSGRFDTTGQLLDLAHHVNVITSKGDEAALQTAHIDLKAGSVSTEQPVQIKLGNALLSADSMTLSDSGNHVIFSGNVRMTLQPQPAAGEPGDQP